MSSIKNIIQTFLSKRKRQKEKEEVDSLIKQMKEKAGNDKDIYFVGSEKNIKMIQEVILDKDIKYKVLPDSYFSSSDDDKVYILMLEKDGFVKIRYDNYEPYDIVFQN